MKSVYGFDDVVLKPLSKFKDWNDYGPLAYAKGAMFLNQIREDFGKETLYDILNKYYNSNRFLNATTEDFVKVSEEVTGTSFEEMTSKWLYGKD
jgi:aminopeptidase N